MVDGMPGKKKIALITGISGQDGYYLSKTLLLKGFVVYGTTRNKKLKSKILTKVKSNYLKLTMM